MSDLYRLADTIVESQLDGAELRWVIPVTIDYVAATARLIMVSGWFDFPEGTEEIWARAVVDAAIGDGDG